MASKPSSVAISSFFRQASTEARSVVHRLVTNGGESLDWIDDLRDLQSHFLDRSQQKAERHCRAGCSGCCLSAQVDVTGIEAIAVSDYLKMCVDSETLSTITNRLQRVTERRTSQMRGLAKQLPLACSMLDESGNCSIYPVRPVICSGVFSTSRSQCDEAEKTARVGDFSGTIPLDNDAIQATGGISGSLQRVLVENQLDGNLYEFNSAVLAILPVRNALERFLAAEDLFADAICTDAHSPPRKMPVRPPHFLKPRSAKRA